MDKNCKHPECLYVCWQTNKVGTQSILRKPKPKKINAGIVVSKKEVRRAEKNIKDLMPLRVNRPWGYGK